MDGESSGFYEKDWEKVDGVDYSGVPKEKARAVGFASSLRGQWIIGMALYVSINVLQNDESHQEDRSDMIYLQETLFPLYKRVRDGDDTNE